MFSGQGAQPFSQMDPELAARNLEIARTGPLGLQDTRITNMAKRMMAAEQQQPMRRPSFDSVPEFGTAAEYQRMAAEAPTQAKRQGYTELAQQALQLGRDRYANMMAPWEAQQKQMLGQQAGQAELAKQRMLGQQELQKANVLGQYDLAQARMAQPTAVDPRQEYARSLLSTLNAPTASGAPMDLDKFIEAQYPEFAAITDEKAKANARIAFMQQLQETAFGQPMPWMTPQPAAPKLGG
jgi:hypothetical protein